MVPTKDISSMSNIGPLQVINSSYGALQSMFFSKNGPIRTLHLLWLYPYATPGTEANNPFIIILFLYLIFLYLLSIVKYIHKTVQNRFTIRMISEGRDSSVGKLSASQAGDPGSNPIGGLTCVTTMHE